MRVRIPIREEPFTHLHGDGDSAPGVKIDGDGAQAAYERDVLSDRSCFDHEIEAPGPNIPDQASHLEPGTVGQHAAKVYLEASHWHFERRAEVLGRYRTEPEIGFNNIICEARSVYYARRVAFSKRHLSTHYDRGYRYQLMVRRS